MNYDNEMLCPRCGGNNLHHGTIKVFDRGEDAEISVLTTVNGGRAKIELVPSSENPSSRRTAVVIEFACEECHNDDLENPKNPLEWVIVQHKGTTYAEWNKP